MKICKRLALGGISAISLTIASTSVLHANIADSAIIEAPDFAAAVMAAEASDWANDESIRGGLHLVAQYDSSGPDAWDVEKHPLVYITSESHQSNNPDKTLDGGFAGFHLIDGYTHEVVAVYIGSNVDGNVGIPRGPHGVSVSPDGKWGYVGWVERTRDFETRQTGFVAVVNMRTMKIDKLLKQQSRYRGEQRSNPIHHVQGCTTDDGQQRVFLQFGFSADGGPHFVLDPADDNRVERAITYDDVHPMGHPFTTASPDCKTLYVSMGSAVIRHAESPSSGVAKVNLETGGIVEIMGTGHHPIGITHTMDGESTFVVDGHGSRVYKIDNKSNSVIAQTSSGVAGPYGIVLNWDESLAFTVGKGEGTHNVGQTLGIFQADSMLPYSELKQQPIFLGGSASSVDHAILHPDPELNELWVSSMKGWETIVLDLNTMTPKAYIPTPHGGDTHNGAFIKYEADWTGDVMSDQGGPVSKVMQQMVLDKTTARKAELGDLSAKTHSAAVITSDPEELLAIGKKLFEETAGIMVCADCHGMDGSGDVGPDIRGYTEDDVFAAMQSVEEMNFLRQNFHIGHENIKAVGAYLEHLGE